MLVCGRSTPFYLVKQAVFSERSAALSTGCARMVYKAELFGSDDCKVTARKRMINFRMSL